MQISYSFSQGLKLSDTLYGDFFKTIPDYDCQVLIYAINAYKPAIVGMGDLTFNQFANEIEKCWSLENPQNAEVCRILRKYSED